MRVGLFIDVYRFPALTPTPLPEGEGLKIQREFSRRVGLGPPLHLARKKERWAEAHPTKARAENCFALFQFQEDRLTGFAQRAAARGVTGM